MTCPPRTPHGSAWRDQDVLLRGQVPRLLLPEDQPEAISRALAAWLASSA